jgi:hypothetical protein
MIYRTGKHEKRFQIARTKLGEQQFAQCSKSLLFIVYCLSIFRDSETDQTSSHVKSFHHHELCFTLPVAMTRLFKFIESVFLKLARNDFLVLTEDRGS